MMTALPANASTLIVHAPISCWRNASRHFLMSVSVVIMLPCTPLNYSAVHHHQLLHNACIARSAAPVTDLSVAGHD